MPFTLKDYTDIQEFATGGMSKIYVAVQISLNRTVIIKEMASGLLTTKNEIKRFENEARSGASLAHDNIIRVYDFGEEKGSFYIAMEFIDGTDLDHLIQEKDCPKEIAMMVLQQALKGLAYAHEQGIVHRDVKPANILISRNGAVKVVDFGLAYANTRSGQLTTTGAIVGTPVYMSPELVNGEETKDRCMDIWAAGVVLYRIMTGEFPFSGENVPSTLIDIIQNKEKPAEELNKTIPHDIAGLLRSCLEKDHTKRLPSLSPLVEAMQNYFFEIGVRDPGDTIKKYFTDKTSALADLNSLLFRYHCTTARELLKTEKHYTALAHFKEAVKYGPDDRALAKEARTLEEYIANTLTSRTATLQDYVVSQVRASERASGRAGELPKPPKKAKKRKGRGLALALALLLLAAIAGAGIYFVYAKRINPWNEITVLADSMVRKARDTFLQNVLGIKPGEHPSAGTPAPAFAREQQAPVQGRTPSGGNEWAKASTDEKSQSPGKPPSAADSAAPAPQQHVTASAGTPVENKAPEQKGRDAYSGIVKAEVIPGGASVKVDGRDLKARELSAGILLGRGVHRFSATADGYTPDTTTVAVLGNDTHYVMINLTVSEKKTGSLQVVSDVAAEIYIDGELKGNTPTTMPITLTEGQHTVVFRRPGFKPYEKTVMIRAGETQAIKVQSAPKNPAE
jgi:serine/threonine protein kinase